MDFWKYLGYTCFSQVNKDDMLIANLWKRKDAKPWALDTEVLW